MANWESNKAGIRSRHFGIPMLLCIFYSRGDGIKTAFWVDVLFVRFGRRAWTEKFFIHVLWPFYLLLVTLALGWLSDWNYPRLFQVN